MATRIHKVLSQDIKGTFIEWTFEESSGRKRKLEFTPGCLGVATIALHLASEKYGQAAHQAGKKNVDFPITPTSVAFHIDDESSEPVLVFGFGENTLIPFKLPADLAQLQTSVNRIADSIRPPSQGAMN